MTDTGGSGWAGRGGKGKDAEGRESCGFGSHLKLEDVLCVRLHTDPIVGNSTSGRARSEKEYEWG